MGVALYTQGFKYYVADNLSRYGQNLNRVMLSRPGTQMAELSDRFMTGIMEISIKQMFGWIAYGCLILLLLFLLYDAPYAASSNACPAGQACAKMWPGN